MPKRLDTVQSENHHQHSTKKIRAQRKIQNACALVCRIHACGKSEGANP